MYSFIFFFYSYTNLIAGSFASTDGGQLRVAKTCQKYQRAKSEEASCRVHNNSTLRCATKRERPEGNARRLQPAAPAPSLHCRA